VARVNEAMGVGLNIATDESGSLRFATHKGKGKKIGHRRGWGRGGEQATPHYSLIISEEV